MKYFLFHILTPLPPKKGPHILRPDLMKPTCVRCINHRNITACLPACLPLVSAALRQKGMRSKDAATTEELITEKKELETIKDNCMEQLRR